MYFLILTDIILGRGTIFASGVEIFTRGAFYITG